MSKKEFTMKPVFTMWIKESKGGKKYLSGKTESGEFLTGFLNGKKKNPKEPDVRVYYSGKDGEELKEYASLWVNVSKTDKKYLSGNALGMKIVGFINSKAEVGSKLPYFSCYESTPKEVPNDSEPCEEVDTDLPF